MFCDEKASASSLRKNAGHRLLPTLLLLSMLATPCPYACADQAGEVDRTILDAMQKSYEFDKAEKAEERLARSGRASRPEVPDADRLYEKARAYMVLEEHEKAKELLSQAADMGHPDALFDYGSMFFLGEGVAQSKAAGVALLEKAASRGSVKAQNILGMIYEIGDGTEKDPNRAFQWTQKAADAGDMEATQRMVRYHMTGIGTKADIYSAIIYTVVLSQRGDAEATERLDAFFRSNEKGIQYLDGFIGSLYLKDDKVKRDIDKAVKWLARAAELGDMHAQHHLGVMYAFGLEVKENKAEGMNLLYAASKQGDFDAMKYLGWIYFHIPRDRTKELNKLRELVMQWGFSMEQFEAFIIRPVLF